MANTFTKLYIHIVFSVKNRHHLIPDAHREELHKYITGIIQNKKHKLIAINSVKDHIHILIGLNPDSALSDLVRDIKSNSSIFINRQGWLKTKFYWQEGYSAFSYGQSQIDHVIKYIENQREHHRKKTFHEEYLEFLKKFQIPYDERFIFDLRMDK